MEGCFLGHGVGRSNYGVQCSDGEFSRQPVHDHTSHADLFPVHDPLPVRILFYGCPFHDKWG